MTLCLTFLGLILVLALGYVYIKRKYNYWADRGVPFVKPSFPFGNSGGVGTKQHFGEMVEKCYKELKPKGPVGGLYLFTEPAVVITDMDLLRNIFVKDFQFFHDRGMYVNERDDPLSAHLFSIEGEQWKRLRAKLSPTFTSGKMKMMHSTILEVAAKFKEHMLELTGGKVTQVEFKELLSQFTTDVIGSVAFGVECNSMKNPNSEFRRVGRKVFESSLTVVIRDFFTTLFPKASRLLRIRTLDADVTNFFMKLLNDTVKHRKVNNVQRNDFLSLLIQIMDTGKLEGESSELGKMTFNELAAQVFVFFVAGFETSSSTMTFALYELALNPELQERARREVHDALERHGDLIYDAAMELRYIDQIIQETLRKYPIAETLFRQASADYKVPSTDIVLEKGMSVLIPVLAIHRDPEIYPEPERFDPERFSKESLAIQHPYAWIPFGKGPRDCIGMRFGMMQTKLGLATILRSFRISPSEKTPIPLKLDVSAPVLSPAGGMFLNIEPVKQ